METNARTSTNPANWLEMLSARELVCLVHGRRDLLVLLKDIAADKPPSVLERSVPRKPENADGSDSKSRISGFTSANGANIPRPLEERNVADPLPNVTDSRDANVLSKDADGLDQSLTPNSSENALFKNSESSTSEEFAVSIREDVSMENVLLKRDLVERSDQLLRDNQDKFVHGRNCLLFPEDVNVANGSISVQRSLVANNSRRLVHSLDQFTTTTTNPNADGPKSTNSVREAVAANGEKNVFKTNATKLHANADLLEDQFARPPRRDVKEFL